MDFRLFKQENLSECGTYLRGRDTNTHSASVLPLLLIEQIAKPIMGTKITEFEISSNTVVRKARDCNVIINVNINELGTIKYYASPSPFLIRCCSSYPINVIGTVSNIKQILQFR
jgi:adenosine/AMP kinase